MNSVKEIGGYFSLDLGALGECNNECFSSIRKEDKIRMNAARYAIVYSVKEGGFSKVFLPIYMCESVKETLEKYNIGYSFYNINKELEPTIESIDENECIMICNYFGLKNKQFYEKYINKFKNIIFDNTQCFYQKPFIKDGIYNVYSPRKFFGVPDGAYLIKRNIKKINLDISVSSDYSSFLLKSIEDGTNSGYKEYLDSESRIAAEGMKGMSKLTLNILSSINYDYVKQCRSENFKVLSNLLRQSNSLFVNYDADLYPMVYSYLTDKEELRTKLINNKVYIPQWWKWVLKTQEANDFEKRLSQFLLPLPIDHRYNSGDMEYIAKLLLE